MRPRSLITKSTKHTVVLYREDIRFKQDFELLCGRQSFMNDVETLRVKWVTKRSKTGEALCWKIPPADVLKLLRKYKLHSRWKEVIREYIVTGEFKPDYYPHAIEISYRENPDFLDVRVYPETNQKEYQGAYKKITEIFKGKDVRKRVMSPRHERNLLIEKLSIAGRTDKAIASEVNRKFPTLAVLGHADVSKIRARNKKKLDSIS